jgi:DNA adenine methylase
MANTKVKTPIVYYGGKTAMLPFLLEMTPQHVWYDEAFIGGGALFWAKDQVNHEAINDKLDIVVNFYQQLKLNYRKLKRLIDASVFARQLLKRANHIFMSHKVGLPVDKVELAWAFWYSCNVSYSQKLYSSGMKYSITGDCKPDVLQKKKNTFTELLLQRIEHVHIDCCDFRYFYKNRNLEGWFHFQDPPYFNADMGHYTGFTENDTIDLLDWNTHCKGKFLLTSYKSVILDEYIEKYGWFHKEISHGIKHPRKSSNGKLVKIELLVSNYSTPCGTLKLF